MITLMVVLGATISAVKIRAVTLGLDLPAPKVVAAPFETAARYTLDLSAVPILKSKTHLPVIVDPTHALGLREFVPQMCLAAVAAGADALMIEVHNSPEMAKSDGNQALTPEIFAELVPRLRAVATAIGRAL